MEVYQTKVSWEDGSETYLHKDGTDAHSYLKDFLSLFFTGMITDNQDDFKIELTTKEVTEEEFLNSGD